MAALSVDGTPMPALPNSADQINYDNTTSGLSATTVKSAVDELASEKQDKSDNSLQTTNKTIVGGINELKSGFTNLDNEVNGDATTYPYADVITIEDAVPSNLADCSVKIEPVQDLHGYDKPWVGGAGKNKLPLVLADIKTANTDGTWNGNAYTVNGVTFTVQTDDDGNVTGINVNGTASGGAAYLVLDGNFNSTALAGCITTGQPTNTDSNIIFRISDQYNFTAIQDLYYNNTITDNGDNLRLSLRININYTVNNVAIYPMIRLATETDATFAPYTNICPITGHTEVDVQRDGKNLFDPDHYETFDLTGEGVNLRYGHQYGTGTYTIINNASNMWYYRVPTKDLIDRGTTQNVSAGSSVTVTVDSSHILWVFCQNWATDSPDDICVRIGSITTYEPYQGKTYTISLGDTIYGGTVDFDSGVMTVDRALITLYGDATKVGNYSIKYPNSPVQAKLTGIISNIAQGDLSEGYRIDIYGGVINIYDALKYIGDGTIESYNDWNANNPVEVCYKLATPFTVQLTPQQIQLLQGQNTLTASTGQISVTANGVSGSIGAVQEQVNDHEERIEDVESGLTDVDTTETLAYTYPQGATIGSHTRIIKRNNVISLTYEITPASDISAWTSIIDLTSISDSVDTFGVTVCNATDNIQSTVLGSMGSTHIGVNTTLTANKKYNIYATIII